MKSNIRRKSWDEFRKSKLLWWVNRSLHIFGWAIVIQIDDKGKVFEAFPARVKYRGFVEEDEDEGFQGLSKYIAKNAETLKKEACQS